MLSYMRKKAKSWIIVVPVGIIILVFVFFYGFSDVRKQGKDIVIASVGDRRITIDEYRTAYKNTIEFYRNIYKNQFTEDMIEKMGLKQQVLEELIDREILLKEAERLDIRVTPEEVRKAIVSSPLFQENGVFSQRLYKRVLGFYGISAVDYERDKEKELKLKTIEMMIKSPVKVSEKELRDIYNVQNEKVKIDYVCFDPEKTEEKPEISENEIGAYYEKNREDFRVPEKVKARYIVFDPKDFESRVEITQEEIDEYYQSDPEQFFEPHQVKARHILLKVEKDASAEKEEEIKKKANNILERLKKGESFAKLAEKHSEDTASAEKGGELGYFKKGDMVKPFEETAFSLKPGETSSPVKTKYGFHLIRVEDVKEARTKPLEEVKDIIEKDLREEKAREFVRKEARRAFNRLFKSREIEQYAEKNDFKLLATDYFPHGKAPADMPGKELFSREAFLLSPGEMAPAFAIGQKYFLLKLEDRKESHIPAVKEVKDEIVKEVQKEKRLQMAKDRANKVLSQLMEGKERWESLEKKYDLKVKETESRRTGDYVSGLGKAKELKEAAFRLEETKQFAPRTFQTNRGIVIMRLKEKQVPEDADFEKEKEKITESVIQNKKKEIFDQFLQNLKSKSELWVNTKLLPTI